MIIKKQGNLLDANGIIVHGCNSQGIMGSGVAKQIKDKWPAVYDRYRFKFLNESLPLGSLTYVRTDPDRLVVNAITQKDYGRTSKRYVSYDAIETAFKRISELILQNTQYTPIPTIVNFPLIGCGLANGDWKIVSKIIDDSLDDSITKVLWIQ